MTIQSDEYWMEKALEQAAKAYVKDEVPIGGVIVVDNSIIASGHNQTIANNSYHQHAEIEALNSAAKKVGKSTLAEATIYVTVEPCLMCLGALVQARIFRLVFGAYEPQTGAIVSRYQLGQYQGHMFDWRGGVLEDKAKQYMQTFFQKKRQENSERN